MSVRFVEDNGCTGPDHAHGTIPGAQLAKWAGTFLVRPVDALKLAGVGRMSMDETPINSHAPIATTAALFERAVREHTRRLLTIAQAIVGNRASPEDVVQQALTNLYEFRERYDWREPGGLMRRAVVNEALRVLRRPRMTAVSDEQPGPIDAPDSAMRGQETVQRVRAAIDQLPPHFRAALVLCEYENMDYAQIALVLDASVPQIKTWLHRGRRQLAQMLEEFGPARHMLASRNRSDRADEEKRR